MNISNRALTLLWLLFANMLVIVSSTSSPPIEISGVTTPGTIDADGMDVTTFDFSTALVYETDAAGDVSTAAIPTAVITKLTIQTQSTQLQADSTTVSATKPTSPSASGTTMTATPTSSSKTTMQSTTKAITTLTPAQLTTVRRPRPQTKPATTRGMTKMPTRVPDTRVKTEGPADSQGQTVSQMLTKKDTGFLPGFDKDSFTAKVILPIAAGIVLAVFIVLIGCSVRSCLEKNGKSNSRKRIMDHDMSPTDRVMLLAESSEDEF